MTLLSPKHNYAADECIAQIPQHHIPTPEEKVRASEHFDKSVLVAAHMAALHDAYIMEMATHPVSEVTIKPSSPTSSIGGLKPSTLKQLKVGKVHRRRVITGTLCAKTLCMKSRNGLMVVNVLEDEEGNATPIYLSDAMEGNGGSAQAQQLYPLDSKVAVKEPYLTRLPDGEVVLLVEKTTDLVFLWVPEYVQEKAEENGGSKDSEFHEEGRDVFATVKDEDASVDGGNCNDNEGQDGGVQVVENEKSVQVVDDEKSNDNLCKDNVTEEAKKGFKTSRELKFEDVMNAKEGKDSDKFPNDGAVNRDLQDDVAESTGVESVIEDNGKIQVGVAEEDMEGIKARQAINTAETQHVNGEDGEVNRDVEDDVAESTGVESVIEDNGKIQESVAEEDKDGVSERQAINRAETQDVNGEDGELIRYLRDDVAENSGVDSVGENNGRIQEGVAAEDVEGVSARQAINRAETQDVNGEDGQLIRYLRDHVAENTRVDSVGENNGIIQKGVAAEDVEGVSARQAINQAETQDVNGEDGELIRYLRDDIAENIGVDSVGENNGIIQEGVAAEDVEGVSARQAINLAKTKDVNGEDEEVKRNLQDDVAEKIGVESVIENNGKIQESVTEEDVDGVSARQAINLAKTKDGIEEETTEGEVKAGVGAVENVSRELSFEDMVALHKTDADKEHEGEKSGIPTEINKLGTSDIEKGGTTEETPNREFDQDMLVTPSGDVVAGETATSLRIKGNAIFARGDFNKATSVYMLAAEKARSDGLTVEEVLCLSNRAEVWLRLCRNQAAFDDAEAALKLLRECGEGTAGDLALAKALFRQGRALMGLHKYEDAMRVLQEVLAKAPGDNQLREAAIKCRNHVQHVLKPGKRQRAAANRKKKANLSKQ